MGDVERKMKSVGWVLMSDELYGVKGVDGCGGTGGGLKRMVLLSFSPLFVHKQRFLTRSRVLCGFFSTSALLMTADNDAHYCVCI